jgi:hypothetical protein
MPWDEVFSVFLISHLVGDYLLQTDWQARHKRGALTGTAVQRRALLSHVITYTLAYVPGLIWLSDSRGAWVIGLAFLIAVPHFIQDDGQLLSHYARAVKKIELSELPTVGAALDQSFHLLALFLTALVAGS